MCFTNKGVRISSPRCVLKIYTGGGVHTIMQVEKDDGKVLMQVDSEWTLGVLRSALLREEKRKKEEEREKVN